jgi:hypothetical protein
MPHLEEVQTVYPIVHNSDSPVYKNITAEHKDYKRRKPQWELVNTLYTGENVEERLEQRPQGEPTLAFRERQTHSDYQNYLGHIIQVWTGILFGNEPERNWGSLGDINNPKDPAYRIWRDADGDGTNYNVLIKEAVTKLLLNNEIWVHVDSPEEGTNRAKITIINPDAVPYWSKNRREVLVKEETIDSSSPTGKEKITWYRLITPFYTQQFKLVHKNGIGTLSEFEPVYYNTPYTNHYDEFVPPIFRIRLSTGDRYVAWNLAKSQRAIYEMSSTRNQSLRSSNFGLLLLATDSDTEFQNIVHTIALGSKAVQTAAQGNSHEYISPSAESAVEQREVINDSVEKLYRNAFLDYRRETSGNVSATEIAASRQEAISSWLNAIVAASADELENTTFRHLAQGYFPGMPTKWNGSVSYGSIFAVPAIQIMQGKPSDFEPAIETNIIETNEE